MSGSDLDPSSGGLPPAARAAPVQSGDPIAVFEEHAVLEKQDVITGRVRIATQTDSVERLATATLQAEAVEVERVVIDAPVLGDLPQIRTEGDVTIIPVFEEIMVVEKRLVLKEELRIRKRSSSETLQVPVTLRSQTAVIERTEAPALLDPNGVGETRDQVGETL